MAMQKVILRPGINTTFTATLNEGGYSYSQLIRFKDGLPEKYGGWQKLIQEPVVGIARGSHAWADLDGNPYLAVGTEQRLQVVQSGQLIDITPLSSTADITPDFTTVMGDKTVVVVDAGHGASDGDWINIVVPVSVGGIILHGFYVVANVLSANSYEIEAADTPTASISNSGAVPEFDTTNTSSTVLVTLEDHGLSEGEQFVVEVSTAVGGLTLEGSYAVDSVVDADSFEIVADSVASSDDSGFENSGDAQIAYLIPTGQVSNTYVSGYTGAYSGPYGGVGNVPSLVQLREWFLDNWGENLNGNYNGSTLYEWVPLSGVPAEAVSGAPDVIMVSLVTSPQQQVMTFGCEIGSVFDPNLIRWCDVGDNTDWTATSINQAGSFRISTGSKIVGAILSNQKVVIWTDVDCWIAQYVGLPFIWSFTKVGAQGNDLIAPRARCNLGSGTHWVSSHGFRKIENGQITIVPCTVWDNIFQNIDMTQVEKLNLASNALFNEVTCFYPSDSGDGEVDSYVKQNIEVFPPVWDYGIQTGSINIVRTTWEDLSAMGNPIGVGTDSQIYQHEIGYDADGLPMNESIQSGFYDMDDGTDYIFIERFIQNFKWLGTNPGVKLFVIVRDYPGGTETTKGPYTITDTTTFTVVRARGRQAAIRIEGRGIGSFWRAGASRYLSAPAGRR